MMGHTEEDAMSYFSVWIDKQHAFIYEFTVDDVLETKMQAHGAHDEAHTEKFYHEVAQKLNNAKEVLLMGPGVAKDQFKHHCEKHHHNQLAHAIVGVRAMEGHPTKAMMMSKAHEFFKTYHNWTKNY
jgi:stalled ribosome rescue protein Dom34